MPRHPGRLIERTAQPDAARMIGITGLAVVFAGSVEQHGGHLPLGTDLFAAQSIAERVAARLGTVAASLGRSASPTTTGPGRARCRCPRPPLSRCSATSAAGSPRPAPAGSSR